MIGMLTGKLIEKDFSSCLIDVNGVGYEVLIPLSTFDKLPLESENITLYIHTAVREDAITLFGFATKDEKQLFQQLIAGLGQFHTVVDNFTAGHLGQAQEHSCQSGLSASGFAYQTYDFPFFNFESYIVYGSYISLILVEHVLGVGEISLYIF